MIIILYERYYAFYVFFYEFKKRDSFIFFEYVIKCYKLA